MLGTKIEDRRLHPGVAAIEWVVAYFYLPSVAPATPAASEKPAAESGTKPNCPAEEEASHHGVSEGLASHAGTAKPHGSMQEVDLGEFTVTAYQPVSSSTLFISFHLYGSVTDSKGRNSPSGWKTTSTAFATTSS